MSFDFLHPRDLLLSIIDRMYQFGMTTTSGSNLSIKEPDSPSQAPARWPLPDPLPDVSISISQDAGAFLCNNARYSLSEATFAGFIHLPPQELTPDFEYSQNWLPLVSQLLSHATQKIPHA